MKKMLPALLPLLLTGCLVEVKTVSDPGPELARARAEVGDCLKKVRLRDLEKMGRGALVEVEDEDGTQVLVWLR